MENASTEITVHPFYQYSHSVGAVTVALGSTSPGYIVEMPEDAMWIKFNHVERMYNNYIIFSVTTAASASRGNVTITNITAFSLLLRWNPPPTDYQNGIICEYLVNINRRKVQIMTC